ncbi:MAG: hypothetical protein ACXW2T_02315 [Allosphingosinicella sp.]
MGKQTFHVQKDGFHSSGRWPVALRAAALASLAIAIALLLPGALEPLLVAPLAFALLALLIATFIAAMAEIYVDWRWGRFESTKESVFAEGKELLEQAWTVAAIALLLILLPVLMVAEEKADWLWRAWVLLLIGGGVVLLAVRLIDLLLYLLSRARP